MTKRGLSGARKKEYLLLLTITLKSQNFPWLGNEKMRKFKVNFASAVDRKELKVGSWCCFLFTLWSKIVFFGGYKWFEYQGIIQAQII